MADVRRLLSDLLTRFALVEEGFSGQDLRDALVSTMNTVTVTEITTNYVATTDNRFIAADATGGAITVTLPLAADAPGFVLTVKRMNGGGNAVALDPQGSDTIDGSGSNLSLAAQYDTKTIVSNGVDKWYVWKAS